MEANLSLSCSSSGAEGGNNRVKSHIGHDNALISYGPILAVDCAVEVSDSTRRFPRTDSGRERVV